MTEKQYLETIDALRCNKNFSAYEIKLIGEVSTLGYIVDYDIFIKEQKEKPFIILSNNKIDFSFKDVPVKIWLRNKYLYHDFEVKNIRYMKKIDIRTYKENKQIEFSF